MTRLATNPVTGIVKACQEFEQDATPGNKRPWLCANCGFNIIYHARSPSYPEHEDALRALGQRKAKHDPA